jgi:hypothetical protein
LRSSSRISLITGAIRMFRNVSWVIFVITR